MADLRALMNTQPQEAARLQNIPTPSPAPSAIAAAANAGSALLGGARNLGVIFQEKKQQEQQAGENAFVGSLADKLIKAQQAGKTDPKFDSVAAQRKILQETLANNPEYAQLAIKAFGDVTGIKAGGMSFEEEQRQKQMEAAWDDYYGSPDASPEVNAQQLEIYMGLQRESHTLALEMQRYSKAEAEGRLDEAAKKKAFIKQSTKLADLEFQSTVIDMEADLQAIQSGEKTLAQVQQEWAFAKVNLGRTLNQFGPLKDDPDVQAILKPMFDMYELAEKNFSGQFDLDAMNRQIEIAKTRMTSLITADEKSLRSIVVSELYGHTPGVSSLMSKHASKILANGPVDVRDLTSKEFTDLQRTIESASKDPKAVGEAVQVQGNVIKHFSRNGEDYTDEEKLQLARSLNTPEVWKKMSPEQRQEAMFAFETYMTDVVDNTIRESLNQSITTSEFTGVTGYREAAETTITKPLSEYATLVVDEAGIRYEINPDVTMNRQIRTKVMSANKALADKVNPAISVMSGASGKTKEQVVTEYLGVALGNEEEPLESDTGASTATSEQPTQDFKAEFIQAAMEDGLSEEEAQDAWDKVSSPATDEVEIGGIKMSRERAMQVLQTPAR